MPGTATMTLGKILKEVREKIPLTLRQVEDATGISNAYLSQLENDKIKKPSASILYKLASVYGLKLETLLQAAGIIEKGNEEVKSNPNSIAFYAKDLDSEQKQKVVEYIQFIRSRKK